MASEGEVNLLKDCYFQASNVDAAVEDGAVVSIKGLRAHDLYTTEKDLNARIATAYDEDYPIWGVVDYVGTSHASVMGVNYRVGDKLAGVHPEAGENTRVRILHEGDEFYLGNENFTGGQGAVAPAVNKFAAPANGLTTWTVANTAPTSGPYVVIEDTRTLIMGQVNEGSTLYRCRVMVA